MTWTHDGLEAVIGLEVHAELLTRSKIFCACSAAFGTPPNTNVCPVCLGMPGVLPVLNRRVVEFAIRAGLATNCDIAPHSRFARKNYFYPDLPKGYQISMYEQPLCTNGWLEILADGEVRRVRLTRIHMEEDTGKNIHDAHGDASLVDFNRSGVALMETVSHPELTSPEEAAAYLRAFRAVLIFLGVCDGNMEEGSLRCDANVSIRPRGTTKLGTKVEIKNLNSFRNVQRALEFEVRRQAQALDSGERIVQETRLWEADRGYTRSMRSKEFAHDYRYFPEPDLVPLRIDRRWVDEIRAGLPELPRAWRQRAVAQYGLPAYDAEVLTQSRALVDYYETALREWRGAAGAGTERPKILSNWIMSELLRVLPGDDERAIQSSPIPPRRLAGLLELIENSTISGKIAKDVFQKMFDSGEDARTIVERDGLTQVADEGALGQVIESVMAANPKAIEDYRRGKKEAKGALVGQVMKATRGKANPALVNRLLEAKLAQT